MNKFVNKQRDIQVGHLSRITLLDGPDYMGVIDLNKNVSLIFYVDHLVVASSIID